MSLTTEEKRARRLEIQRRYREKNQDAIKAYNRAYQNREVIREKRRRRREKNNQLTRSRDSRRARLRKLVVREAEAGRPRPDKCEVCGDGGPINFDHCHQRGIFRGWLCNSCNKTLGFAKDDPNRLRKLIAYLERTKDYVSPQYELPV